jgi:nitroreductase
LEFKRVVGTRRSIRFFEPWRPVEKEKIQAILEAAYQAPRLMETDFIRAVVVYRDELGLEKLQSIKTPTTSAQLDMAPVYIFFFADVSELERVADGRNYCELVRRNALTSSHGWSEQYVEGKLAPYLRSIIDESDRTPLRWRRSADDNPPTVGRTHMSLARNAVGIAQAYALLAAVDQGLGVQLTSFSHAQIFDAPETWTAGGNVMLVGYPGESVEAGGQRPREAFDEDFFELRYGNPFYREPAVVQKLTEAGVFQAPAPFPWRFEEMRALAKKYGLPE